MKVKAQIDRFIGKDNRIKAYASVILGGEYVIRDIAVMDSKNGVFARMPYRSYKDRNGQMQYADVVFALNETSRNAISDAVLEAYEQRLHMEEDEQQDMDEPEDQIPAQTAEEKTEPVVPETSKPVKPTAPAQESSAPPKSTSVQVQKPTDTAPNPSAPPKIEMPEPTVPPAPTEPPKEAEQPAMSEPAKGFTQADHEHIVAEVTAYAENYRAKGFTFEWKETMEFGWDVGYMGTPRISRDGIEGTIRTLKYHVDLIVSTSTDPANGITTEYMTYKVVQIEIDGGIAYAVIYGG